ncbi:Ser/Thr protein phosphatase, putative [Trichomonas vaginalis G3]|uniref:Serine/threonine-protein phosphatase n=1 Tax=Trichomonas vaginalis (strain ATCC PRA-98 / G3) TaxID=412133 RepID=A2G4Y4_TRIV3|nr:Ser/Thr protein phosphatase, putative [Trichomonas vaginalis G3]|eukprot:XP_001300715.1 Ser/Thr protein phosphatase [Trichomonas vaginalis G3]
MFNVDSLILRIIKHRAGASRNKNRPNLQFKTDRVQQILELSIECLKRDPILLKLPSDIIVVGDLHGNIDALLRIFSRCGYPPNTKYLFLGDYVDRGENSVDVFLLLLCLKIRNPNCVFLLRGNHESIGMTRIYGFRDEVLMKLDKKTYLRMAEVFRYLPIAAVINKKIFCVHGGISKDLLNVDQLLEMEKPTEVPLDGPIADLLWSDPRNDVLAYEPSDRGSGYLFGPDACNEFLETNGFDLLVRSHESCSKGFDWVFQKSGEEKDRCLTIFSSHDYCMEGNDAGVLKVNKDGNFSIITFIYGKNIGIVLPDWGIEEPPHDTVLPPKVDLISISDLIVLAE